MRVAPPAARCASSASPATAPRSTRKAQLGWQAAAVRRHARVRDAEPERAERAREAGRLRRALPRSCRTRDPDRRSARYFSSRAFFSSVSSASWYDALNAATPSRSNVAVTSSKSTPASASPAMTARASSRPCSTASARKPSCSCERVDRRLRERVDRVAADQLVDVQRGGVRRVLRRRRRPQRPLQPRAGRREIVPARAR